MYYIKISKTNYCHIGADLLLEKQPVISQHIYFVGDQSNNTYACTTYTDNIYIMLYAATTFCVMFDVSRSGGYIPVYNNEGQHHRQHTL